MNKFMKIARELAKENLKTNKGGPFGAVVVKNNTIISTGSNQVLGNNDPTAHAEIEAIRKACSVLKTHDLSGCEIYTNCHPCPMCLSAIIWANIKVVYYGNTEKDAENIGFRDNYIYNYFEKLLNNAGNCCDVLKAVQIDRVDTMKEFELFKKKHDKIIY
jgi:tRNA(Arg) A34 adenosine deaminase TadA